MAQAPKRRSLMNRVLDVDDKAASTRFKKGMTGVMKTITDSPHAGPFMGPVRKSEAPGYAIAVKRPMCVRDAVRRIKEGQVTTPDEVLRDVYLIFANAVQFNAVDSDVVKHARELSAAFEL